MDTQQTYTLTEAAKLTGLSVDAIRKRIRRGKMTATRGNDGLWKVRLSAEDMASQVDQAETSQELAEPDTKASHVLALEGALEVMREALSASEDREAAAVARAQTAEREREEARVKAAAAEGLAEGLRLALDEARKPFWRRWLG